jgi:hypothetical protein
MKVAASGVWDLVQRGAHYLVESGVQHPQSQPLRPRLGTHLKGNGGLLRR